MFTSIYIYIHIMMFYTLYIVVKKTTLLDAYEYIIYGIY